VETIRGIIVIDSQCYNHIHVLLYEVLVESSCPKSEDIPAFDVFDSIVRGCSRTKLEYLLLGYEEINPGRA
jgi:hypothetical protein